MFRTRIKLCGMMRPEDALAAARAGADAIGIILFPHARRYVDEERARGILDTLPPFVTAVGVFVNQPTEQVRQTAQRLGLSTVQLHGDESPRDVAALKPLAVIKAIPVAVQSFHETLRQWRQGVVELNLSNLKGLVLETATGGVTGGTGVENDWQAIADAQSAGLFDGLPPIILAGGLRPDNVGQVVRPLRPWGVDTSSGIEPSLGEKSPDKMRAFIHAVRKADSESQISNLNSQT